MREMTENVAVVQPSHGDLRNNHLQEGRESRKDAKLVFVEPKPSRGGEIAPFHDPRGEEDFRMLLMD